MSRRAVLIVNPHAGGGRAEAALPRVEARLGELGVAFHTERTRSLEHACELAAAAAEAGEVAVTLSGDGLIGAVAGTLRRLDGAVLGVLPGGRGNDFARVAGIPLDPEAACDVIANGVERPLDVGEVAQDGGRTFVGIASLGFDSDANRIANEAPARLGRLVYAYGAEGAVAAVRSLGAKVAAARAAGALSRATGRGGTSLPGKVLLRLDPHAIGALGARLGRGSALISATNGKTTTAAMAAGILKRGGGGLVHNRAGANMASGIATTLLRAAGNDGPLDDALGLFEVDEFWLGQVVEELRPRALVLA